MKENELNSVCDFLSNKCLEQSFDITKRLVLISNLGDKSLISTIRNEQITILRRNGLFFSKVVNNCELYEGVTFQSVIDQWIKVYQYLKEEGEAPLLSNYIKHISLDSEVLREKQWLDDLIEYITLLCLASEYGPVKGKMNELKQNFQMCSVRPGLYIDGSSYCSPLEKRIVEKARKIRKEMT